MQITKTTHLQIKKTQKKPTVFVIETKEPIDVTIEVLPNITASVVGFVIADNSHVSINYILQEGSVLTQQLFGLACDTKKLEIAQSLQFAAPNSKGTFDCLDLVKTGGMITHQAKIVIAQQSQKADASLQMKGYILDKKSQITLVPELDVLANDVKATHAASTVLLQDDQVFYIQSRGLPLEEISGMMVQSFLEQGMQEISAADRKKMTVYIQPWIS